METSDVVLSVRNLKKHFKTEAGNLRAVDGVSFEVKRGENFALVGESGCGKTTAGLTILRLYEPTAGEVFLEGKNVFQARRKEMSMLRREMQMIFQDPFASLNPRLSAQDIIGEPFDIHGHAKGVEKEKRVSLIMDKVGLSVHQRSKYPHEFSGGERQRIGIARALAVEPKLIIADEPVSALDISIRGQIINLIQDLKEEFKLTILFISHDLSLVKYFCDRVAVMYLGKILELATAKDLFCNPLHPYTKALMSSVLIPDPTLNLDPIVLKGEVPSAMNPPSGCRFHPRCAYAKTVCAETEPELVSIGSKDERLVACHLTR